MQFRVAGNSALRMCHIRVLIRVGGWTYRLDFNIGSANSLSAPKTTASKEREREGAHNKGVIAVNGVEFLPISRSHHTHTSSSSGPQRRFRVKILASGYNVPNWLSRVQCELSRSETLEQAWVLWNEHSWGAAVQYRILWQSICLLLSSALEKGRRRDMELDRISYS